MKRLLAVLACLVAFGSFSRAQGARGIVLLKIAEPACEVDTNNENAYTDQSGKAQLYELLGSANWTSGGNGGQCIRMGGRDGYASVSGPPSLLQAPARPYAIEVDVNLATVPDDFKFVVDGMAADQSGIRLATGGYPVFRWVTSAGSFNAQSGIALAPGRWYHLRGEWDGQYGRLFVDGQKVAEGLGAGAGSVWRNLHIGNISAGGRGTGQFGGCIDNVVVMTLAAPASAQPNPACLRARALCLKNEAETKGELIEQCTLLLKPACQPSTRDTAVARRILSEFGY